LISFLGSYVGPVGEPLAALLNGDVAAAESFAKWLALLIFGSCIILSCIFGGRIVWWRAREIKHLANALQEIGNPVQFVDAFPRVAARFERSALLAERWREFEETLLKPEPGKDSIVRITIQPSEYLSRERCGLHFPIWHVIPNYFVGIGLLLTFIGLLLALNAASKGINSTDVAQANDALKDLLTAASFKFWTSIAGLSSSIIFSFVYHVAIRYLDAVFERLCSEIERLTQFAAPEAIADEQLRELEKQTLQLERFNTDLGMQIANGIAAKLDASIAEGLRRAIEPLGQSVERLASSLGSQNLDALEAMAESFRSQLQAGAGREFERVAMMLGEVRQSLGEQLGGQIARFGAEIGDASHRLGEAATAMAGRMEGGAARAAGELERGMAATTERLGESLTRTGVEFSERLGAVLQEVGATLAPLHERLASFTASLSTLDDRLGQQASAFAQTSAQAYNAAHAVSEAADRMRSAAEPVATTARELGAAATVAKETLSGLHSTREEMSRLGDRLESLSATLDRSWQAYSGRFEQVDERLSEIFGTFTDGTRAYQEQVREFVVTLNQELSQALRAMAGGIDQLEKVIEDLAHKLRPETFEPAE
jgi:methyl-accepting chemotaxis protein